MKVAVFSAKPYTKEFLDAANEAFGFQLEYFETALDMSTVPLVEGFDAVCAFVNDDLSGDVVCGLKRGGTNLIALRSAGFNNVDIEAAEKCEITVVRVPAYSPHAVAEHAVALMLTLNRKTHRAFNRVRESNFSLEGLLGFDMNEKTVGIVGTGKIGATVAKIMDGFGCRILAYDKYPNDSLRSILTYVELEQLFRESDILTLHCPLTPETHHLINPESISQMKDGVMIINTSRGAVIDSAAAINGLKDRKIGYLGLDVYEEEEGVFFQDLSSSIMEDDQLARLISFPNVIITGHQAFFTDTALSNIAQTTLENIRDFQRGELRKECIVSPRPE